MRYFVSTSAILALVLSGCGDATVGAGAPQPLGQSIFGGTAPDPNTPFDAVAGIFIAKAPYLYYCSGTLIAPDVVLTAAHCLDVGVGRKFRTVDPSNLEVFFGPEMGDWGTGLPAADAVIHEGYDPKSHGVNDLGLIWLQSEVPDIAPIPPLPAAMVDHETVGTPCTFAGYGSTENDTIGTKLVVDGSIAAVEQFELMNEQDDGTGTCGGDSGGPLLYEIDNALYVGGTTSWGDSDCTDYGWSMRVSAHEEWLTALTAVPEPECALDADCGDSDLCTINACVAGACVDSPTCNDDDTCTEDICDSATGACTYPAIPDCGSCLPKKADCDSNDECCSEICRPSGRCG